MKTLFWICEKCGAEIIVEPIETTQYRHISCEGCGAEFAVLNSELREKESPAAADRSWRCTGRCAVANGLIPVRIGAAGVRAAPRPRFYML